MNKLDDKQNGIIKAFVEYGIDIADFGRSVTLTTEIKVDEQGDWIDLKVSVANIKKPIEVRKSEFYNLIVKTVEGTEFNKPSQLRKFFDYWSEHGVNDKKMRFEKETSFDVKRRLNTWFSNAKRFEGENNRQSSILDKKLGD